MNIRQTAILAMLMLGASHAVASPVSADADYSRFDTEATALVAHTYTFSAGLQDSTGLIDLEGQGGGIGAGRFIFGPNQGLTLSDALADPQTFSIEMSIQFDQAVSQYFKLIDFSELTADAGLYFLQDQLVLYPMASGTVGPILPGVDYTVVLTRDDLGEVNGYIDGQLAFSVTDSTAAFPAANVLNFVQDDSVTGGIESRSGSINYLRIYDDALSAQAVANLTPPVANITGDTIFGLLGFGASGMLNGWNPNVNGGPIGAIVLDSSPEFLDVANTEATDFLGDIEADQLTLRLINLSAFPGSGGAFSPRLTSLDFETPIVGLEVISDTFPGGAQSIEFTADSISVQLRPYSIGVGESQELVLRILTAEISDSDVDGVPNDQDNCLLQPNAGQIDADGDGYGNACDADLNNDCTVNIVDLGEFRTRFFSDDAEADFNGDGTVNVVDLGRLRTLFFAAPGPSGLTTSCGD